MSEAAEAGWREDPGVRLMLAFQQGDERAFEELVLLYQGAAFSMLRRILGPAAPLEDLAQEAFVRIWRSRERYQPGGKFSTFLFRIAYNLALNQVRDAGRKPWQPLHEDGEAGRGPAEALPEALARRLDQPVWSDRIAWALQALPENQRAALVFQHYEGLDLAEIGEILGLSPQAVKSLLHRARERMRTILEPHWNSEQ